MTWFESLTGCSEDSPETVRTQLAVDGRQLRSRRNGRSWLCGDLETPTLAQLRNRVRCVAQDARPISLREVIANVQDLHADKANKNALFQVASQFNLLEMATPDVTPERGVGIYEWDHSQGPACAVSAGAGTIFRNYFVLVNSRVGQSTDNQIDCLAGIGALLGNTNQRLWQMVNGYTLSSANGLKEIHEKLEAMDATARDRLRQALQIGLQWDTQVTLDGSSHVVSQAYCSALSVAYCEHPTELWAPFATLVLEAAYEATICAAIINAHRTGKKTLFLTLLGGGAFGNDMAWIMGAIRRSVREYSESGLDIAIVSYGRSNPCVQRLVSEFV